MRRDERDRGILVEGLFETNSHGQQGTVTVEPCPGRDDVLRTLRRAFTYIHAARILVHAITCGAIACIPRQMTCPLTTLTCLPPYARHYDDHWKLLVQSPEPSCHNPSVKSQSQSKRGSRHLEYLPLEIKNAPFLFFAFALLALLVLPVGF